MVGDCVVSQLKNETRRPTVPAGIPSWRLVGSIDCDLLRTEAWNCWCQVMYWL